MYITSCLFSNSSQVPSPYCVLKTRLGARNARFVEYIGPTLEVSSLGTGHKQLDEEKYYEASPEQITDDCGPYQNQ